MKKSTNIKRIIGIILTICLVITTLVGDGVIANAATYSISKTSTYILPSGFDSLSVNVTGTNSSINAHWISYNTNKAVVDFNTGLVVAQPSAMGTQTTVAAYVNGSKVGTCVINIGLKQMSILNLSGTNNLFMGDSTQLYLTYKENGNVYPYETHWISYNTSKATVDYNTGVVTAGSVAGTTTIAAYVNGNKVATYSINIKNPTLVSVSNPNATTVTLQPIWEYAPCTECRILFNLIKNNVEGSTYTFSSYDSYREALKYYKLITNDTKIMSRVNFYSKNVNGTKVYYVVIRANDDNVAYTSGTKGTLVYFQAAYYALSNIGVKNGMKKTTAYQKIADYVASINTYDDTHQKHDFSYIFDDGTSVCMGYAELTQMMCIQAGIDNTIVVSETHAWNKVNLGGSIYQSDITWYDDDSGNFDKTYYLSTNGWTDKSHIINEDEYTFYNYHYWID
jgi:hypothetical protein